MKKLLLLICLLISCTFYAQDADHKRIENIKNNLLALSVENTGLTENLKLDINVTNVTLSNFLIAVSKVHKININVAQDLQNINIVNNFSDVNVSDLLVFLCKEYSLDINFTGSILSIKKYIPPVKEIVKEVHKINYDALNNLISLDLKNHKLDEVFRSIIDVTGQNLLYNNSMENIPLNLYLHNVPFDTAMKKLAETNNLIFSKSKDGFYLFDRENNLSEDNNQMRRNLINRENYQYQILDTVNKLLTVNFKNTSIASIINEISRDLNLDVYTATPLKEAGNINFKAKHITYDKLLEYMFENGVSNTIENVKSSNLAQNNTNQNRRTQNQNFNNNSTSASSSGFTFKKEDNIYFFGTSDQLSVRNIEVIQLMHRSIELLGDPMQNSGANRSAGRTVGGNVNYLGGGLNGGLNNQGFNNNNRNLSSNQGFGNSSRRINTQSNSFGSSHTNSAEALVNILPDDIKTDLDIRVDFELNSFLVSGPAANINRFKKFIKEIDKPVPVILIEVMLIEVKKSSTVETGISWGIADEPSATKGKLFPEADFTLGAKTINKVIGGFDGFGSFNIGRVVPEFFANIKALEANGNIKIRSTPKLSTLNGHRANMSIGETTYYVVTNQNFFGVQNPTSSEIRNYQPIDAELAISIKPLVSGNGQITLDINVIQSDFSGERIENDAPPGLTSREFSSIIRMQDQDLAVLGGLEEKTKNDSGNGVPFLARVPIIKWLFSSRKREDSKQKLTILIKPTVIY